MSDETEEAFTVEGLLINIHISLMRLYDIMLMNLVYNAGEIDEELLTEIQTMHREGSSYFPPGPNDVVIQPPGEENG